MALVVTVFKNMDFVADLFPLNMPYAYFPESATGLALKKQPLYVWENLVMFAQQVEKINIWNGFCICLFTFMTVWKIRTSQTIVRILQNSHILFLPKFSSTLGFCLLEFFFFNHLFTFAFPASSAGRGPQEAQHCRLAQLRFHMGGTIPRHRDQEAWFPGGDLRN